MDDNKIYHDKFIFRNAELNEVVNKELNLLEEVKSKLMEYYDGKTPIDQIGKDTTTTMSPINK